MSGPTTPARACPEVAPNVAMATADGQFEVVARGGERERGGPRIVEAGRLPLPANSIDVVISNCVINLSTDRPAVFAEMFRVLTPGGRIGISDVVADDTLTSTQRAERGGYVGCIAGALSFTEYRHGLEAAGFTNIEINPTHAVADGMHSAIVRATKPATAARLPLVTQEPQGHTAGPCCGHGA